jgi:hypothetical protein
MLGTPKNAFNGTQRQHRALGTPIFAFVFDLWNAERKEKRGGVYIACGWGQVVNKFKAQNHSFQGKNSMNQTPLGINTMPGPVYSAMRKLDLHL